MNYRKANEGECRCEECVNSSIPKHQRKKRIRCWHPENFYQVVGKYATCDRAEREKEKR